MAAGSTYTPIATYTATGTIGSYTFSSIPSTYTDLIAILTPIAGGGAADIYMTFNGDTGSNYSASILYGSGSSAGNTTYSNQSNIIIDFYGSAISSEISNRILQIQNYSNTTTYKTALSRANRAGSGVDAIYGMWRSTAAISSITFTLSSSFASGSTFTLYGITAA